MHAENIACEYKVLFGLQFVDKVCIVVLIREIRIGYRPVLNTGLSYIITLNLKQTQQTLFCLIVLN